MSVATWMMKKMINAFVKLPTDDKVEIATVLHERFIDGTPA